MKSLTYEDWLKNSTPRLMWVWDKDEKDKVQRRVIYFIEDKNTSYPVVVLSSDHTLASNYKHCAEIIEEPKRRMTHKELSRWLRERPSREYKYQTSDYICSAFDYRECKQNEEVHEDIRIREDGGEWKEPLLEIEE